MEKLFKLNERGTSVRTEFFAGLTTFMTMAYILAVNPALLSASGMDTGAIFTATALASAIASFPFIKTFSAISTPHFSTVMMQSGHIVAQNAQPMHWL